MKSLSVKFGVVLIGLAIFCYSEVWGADWKPYYYDDEVIRYYDADGVTRPSKNIVRVWDRVEYTDKGVIEIVKELGKKYENFGEKRMLREINCSDRKMRVLSITEYSKKGEVIFSSSHEGEWAYVVPDSVGETLYEAVCKWVRPSDLNNREGR